MSDVRLYEEVLVLRVDREEKQENLLFQELDQVIKEAKGSLEHAETWENRPLASPGRKKLAQGKYIYRVFYCSGQALKELKRKLRINDLVIYFHQQKLNDKVKPSQHVEKFHDLIKETAEREQERFLKAQKHKAKMQGARA